MAYEPTQWVNDFQPDVDAEHLNKMEAGIVAAHVGVDNNAVSISSVSSRVTKLEQGGAGSSYRRYTKDVLARGARADGATDNTGVLQAILDECRDAGVGEVYFPGKPGDTYNTKGLWVPSGCKLVSDVGVILRITGSSGHHAKDGNGKDSVYIDGDLRVTSWDGDLVASDGLYFGTQTRLDSSGRGGATARAGAGGSSGGAGVCHDVGIENLIVVGGTCVYQAVDGVKITNVTVRDAYFGHAFANVRNGDQGYNEIDACRDVTVREGFTLNVVRNGLELSSVRGILIDGHTVIGVTGATSTEQAPAVGIENESEASTSAARDIRITGCRIEDCAGAGLAFIRGGGPTDTSRFVVSATTIHSVGTKPLGSSNGPDNVGTTGAIWLHANNSWEVISLVGVQAESVARGRFLSTSDGTVACKVLASGCAATSGNTGHDGGFDGALVQSGCVGV